MAFTNIKLEKHERIGTLTLNRPEKLNAMTPALIGEFGEAIDEVAKDPEVKVLVIRGAGRAFSTGYDLTGGWGEGASKPFTIDDDQRFCSAISNTGCVCATCRSRSSRWCMAIAWPAPLNCVSARI